VSDLAQSLRRNAIAGIRGSMTLSFATLPLSFATNIMLGRVSPEALGYYSAVQLCLYSYFTFLVFGGVFVFTRLVPALERRERASFLATYFLFVAGVSALGGVVLVAAFPSVESRLLVTLGHPQRILVAVFLATGLAWGFASYFLFSVLESVRGTAVDKSAVVGFFVAACLGYGPLRARLVADPSSYLWTTAAVVYALGAMLGIAFVLRTPEWRERGPWRIQIPTRFWSTVAYTHMDTVVTYVYLSLSPAIVLLWLDVGSLGRFHAAMRYVMLLGLLPGTISSVLAPALSRLDVSGLRDVARLQATAAMRAAALGVVPVVIVLVLFAEDAMRLFGEEFRRDGDLLRLAILSVAAAPTVHIGGGLAAGFGAFRAYFAASTAYVVVALGLAAILVPLYGLPGAAVAVTLGAAARQAAILGVLRWRLEVPWPGRIAAAWGCSLAAATVSWTWRPGRLTAAAAAVVLILAFFAWSRVTVTELRGLRSKAMRGA